MSRSPAMHLSPYEHHAHVLKNTAQTMRYDGGDVTAWQRKLRRVLRRLVNPVPLERTPLRPRVLWEREHALGSIQKLVFAAEPKADVTAYLCLPRDVAPPYTCFVCVQGHSSGMHNSIGVERDDERKPMQVEGDRDFGLSCMRNGLAALCIEQRAFGERRELAMPGGAERGCYDAAMHAMMLGRTLIGERVYDIDRGIDYLASRDDINMKRIGMMGNSGGGTATVFAAALLPRIAFAMPSCYFCTFADSIMSIHHCLCNYVPGLLQYAEMADVLGLFAPKPVVVVAGRHDPIFPLAATRRAFRHLQRIYRAAGAPSSCRLVVGEGEHRFYADDAWPVMLRLMQ